MSNELEKIVAKNLRRIREAKRFSADELAEQARLSPNAYRKIEAGETPTADFQSSLRAIASILGVPFRRMVEEVRPLKGVRFRSTKHMHDREQILADVSRWFYNFCDIEQLVEGGRSTSKKISGQSPPTDVPDLIKSAMLTRNHLGLNDKEPISSIRKLLEIDGSIKVGEVKTPSRNFFGLSVSDENHGQAIVVNTWENISVERWIFTAAHELGHLVLHPSDYDIDQTAEDKEIERQADRFASYFLMPRDAFKKEWQLTSGRPLLDRVLTVKSLFNVSYQTVLYRLHEENGGDKKIWGRFQFEFKRRYGKTLPRSIEPHPLPEEAFSGLFPNDFPPYRLPALVLEAIEKEKITIAHAAAVLEISIGEMYDLLRGFFVTLAF